MPEKKGYGNALFKGIARGFGWGIFISVILLIISESFFALGSIILWISIVVSVHCAIAEVKKENEEAEERYQREQERYRIEQQKQAEIQKLEYDFCQKQYVVPQINSSPFKEDLLLKLKELLNNYEYRYYDILRYPDKIKNPSSVLLKIALIMEKHTVFWESRHNEWHEHLKYAFSVDDLLDDSDSIVLRENGQINAAFINQLKEISTDKFNEVTDAWLLMENTEEKLKFNIPITALWKYAMTKPIDMERYNKVKKVLTDYIYRIDTRKNKRIECYDVVLAELFIAKEFGNQVLETKRELLDCWVDFQIYQYKEIIKINEKEEPKHLEHMITALRWMGLYAFEADVLRKMVTEGVKLSNELQERLRFIENVGNDLKKVYDIEENAAFLSLDYATLNWQEKDFIKLFQTLVFENLSLKYALTIREWSKNVLMEKKTGLDMNEAFEVVKNVIYEEYLTSVKCKKTEAQLLTEDGSESRKTALLMVPDKEQTGFGYIGLLLNIIGFGRNINLRLYTIFIPEGTDLETQKQQVLTLKKGANPDIMAFENGLQASVLKGMEEYMNTGHAKKENVLPMPETYSNVSRSEEPGREQLF